MRASSPCTLSVSVTPPSGWKLSLLPSASVLPVILIAAAVCLIADLNSESTARLVSTHGQNSGSETSSVLSRKTSTASSYKPPARYGAPAASEAVPPPAYSSGAAATGALAGKRPAPPPPRPKPASMAPQVEYVTALYDYAATAEGDLSFAAGDRIELVKKTDSTEDWWTGRLNGVEGVFPGELTRALRECVYSC